MSGFAGLGASLGAAVVIFFLAVPVVSYSVSFNIPNNTIGRPVVVCAPIIQPEIKDNTITANATLDKEYQACLQKNAYPPTALTGTSSLSYSMFGVGSPPFPSYALAVQGEESLLVTFRGLSVAFVEGPFGGQTRLNPPGLISVDRLAILQGEAGTLNFTATIHNISNDTLEISQAFFDYPGLGTNHTSGGLNWHTSEFWQGYPCLGSGGVFALSPGGACVVHDVSGPEASLVPGKSYPLKLVVAGFPYSNQPQMEATTTTTQSTEQNNTTTSSSATLSVVGEFYPPGGFVSVFTEQATYPGSVPNAEWVNEFISQVNSHRQTPLTETPSLDAFAQQRFKTASSQPYISDYNFTQDADAWFGVSAASATEVLLFPAYLSPDAFVSFLQSSAPQHWSALTNPDVGKFGYYVGQGPYFEAAPSCPVSEVPGGVNITQYIESRGCTVTPVPDATWLVIVMTP